MTYTEVIDLEKNPNTALVYIINTSDYKESIPELWQYLFDIEKERAQNFYTKDLRDQYIISHGILRCILAHYTARLPENIEFIYNKHGKPFLKNSNIQFNMSHSCDVVSYIIALDCMVGIDIELYDEALIVDDFADIVFTTKEYQFFTKLDKNQRLKFFYSCWTKKESFVKAIGRGLTYPLNIIETIIPHPDQKLLLRYKNNKQKKSFYCFSLKAPQKYFGAIAVEDKINKIIYLN